MQIVHIFGSRSGPENGEGLWAVKYERAEPHAFREMFTRFEDPDWMLEFCQNNLDDIVVKFKRLIAAEDAALELMKESQMMKAKIVALAKEELPGMTLQEVFQPLYPSESNLLELQLSKGSVKHPANQHNPKLRIYAVRFSSKTYAVTGGAIKLTDRMEERLHTELEYRKMLRVRDWLKDEGFFSPEDLKEVL
jgi:hypothetical protein